jgi:hypothetical protein
MRESTYQAGLIKRIYKRFPGCIVQKLDTGYQQGIPDLAIFFSHGFWASLEVKVEEPMASDMEPNQEYFVELMDSMSFSRFIYPQNEEAVLNELQAEYENYRAARIP